MRRRQICRVLQKVAVWLRLVEPHHPDDDRDLLRAVDEARREWLAAKAYFDSVSDPTLIEHAIFTHQAAEKRYMHLLNEARERRLTAEIPSPQKSGKKL